MFTQLLLAVLHFYTIRAQTSQKVQYAHQPEAPQSQQEKQAFAQRLAASYLFPNVSMETVSA